MGTQGSYRQVCVKTKDFWSTSKRLSDCFQGLKTFENTDLHVRTLFLKCYCPKLKILVLENYKIVVPLFGAAYMLHQIKAPQISSAGPRSAVGNVSGYRCVSDCRSRGREFDPGPVPYFRGDWSWNDFYGHSPPFRWFIQEGLLSVTSESMCTNNWLTACSSLPRKKVWLGELTVPQWP